MLKMVPCHDDADDDFEDAMSVPCHTPLCGSTQRLRDIASGPQPVRAGVVCHEGRENSPGRAPRSAMKEQHDAREGHADSVPTQRSAAGDGRAGIGQPTYPD